MIPEDNQALELKSDLQSKVSGQFPYHGSLGMYGPPPRRKRKMDDRLVCANVYGLCWSKELRARMECAALSSHLVGQS
jgi:hypothetical protein